jgi:hypothetical protein
VSPNMQNPSLFKTVYRVLSWGSLLGLLLILFLMLRKSPAPDIPYDPDAAARAQQKFVAASQAQAAGQPSQVQLNPAELNSYLSQNLEMEGSKQPNDAASQNPPVQATPAPHAAAPQDNPIVGLNADGASIEDVQSSVRDVKIDMDGDLVKACVVFDYHGKDLSLELDGHLRTQDGYLKFDPVAGKIGSLPLPQSTLDSAVEKMMNSPENREKLRLPPDVSDIQIANGQAVVSYK